MLDNSWVGGQLVTKGTRQVDVPPGIVGLVGSHLWVDETVGANIDATTGEALTGLKDTVWIDGKSYAKGSIPPADVIPKVGVHMWVQGFAPTVEAPVPVDSVASEPAQVDEVTPISETEGVAGGSDGDEPSIPPKGGPGSGKSAWADYARAHNVSVEPGSSREDIIDQLDDAGVPTE